MSKGYKNLTFGSKAALGFALLGSLLIQRSVHAEPKLQTRLTPVLSKIAPRISEDVLKLALKATSCAFQRLQKEERYLAVIDYSLPSSEKRFWLFDLEKPALLREELVAHGKGSGEGFANRFSNAPGSYQSSLGLFASGETYQGQHGYSLRLVGLENGFNDNAFSRAIVLHGADYVSESFIQRWNRLGRSQGCPALPVDVAPTVIKTLKEGSLLFSYYPDEEWLEHSPFLNRCGSSD